MKIRKWVEEIHPLDQGTTQYEVITDDGKHDMTIIKEWANCGNLSETVECSCGFYSYSQNGTGCWQHDHNTPVEHTFDDFHKRLYKKAVNS